MKHNDINQTANKYFINYQGVFSFNTQNLKITKFLMNWFIINMTKS